MQVFAFDMDGTLLNQHHHVSPKNRKALEDLKAKGAILVLASGRPETLMKAHMAHLPMVDYLILCNGAIVKSLKTDAYLLEQPMSQKMVIPIVEAAKSEGVDHMLYAKEMIITHPNERVDFYKVHQKDMKASLKADFLVGDDVLRLMEGHKIFKVLLMIHEKARHDAMWRWLQSIPGIEATQSSKGFIDIMASGVNKQQGLAHILDLEGAKTSDLVAFGDQMNDLEMLHYAGVAITTNNAVDAVKAMADYVSLSHNEDGVAYALKQYLNVIE